MLDDDKRTIVVDRLANRIENLKRAPYRTMVLCGPPSCGKSAVSRETAERHGFRYVDFLEEMLLTMDSTTLQTFGRSGLREYMRTSITQWKAGAIFDELDGLFATWKQADVRAFFTNLLQLKVDFPCIVVTSEQVDFAKLGFDADRVCKLG